MTLATYLSFGERDEWRHPKLRGLDAGDEDYMLAPRHHAGMISALRRSIDA